MYLKLINMQDFLLDLKRELKYRNYSSRIIEVYSTCIKYFLKYIKDDISKITKDTIIDKEEILKIIENTKNTKHKLLISLSYSSWLRVSEIINLKINDVNLEELTIHIKWAKWKKDRITVFSEKLKNDLWKIISFKNKKYYISFLKNKNA